MHGGTGRLSLEGSADDLVTFGAGLVPRAVGLGRLIHASAAGAAPALDDSDRCSVSLAAGGGSWTVSCGGRPGPAPITAQGPRCTLDPQGPVLSVRLGSMSL